MNPDQIESHHRSRLAYVYVRQSSEHQVFNHRESQHLQRALAKRARTLGWPEERVLVFDDDLGQSAARHQQRDGFTQLVAQVALGKVGIVFAFQVSRLSRGNRNWYHLLDICSVTKTLVADGEGVYDPRLYNDRLLLGLKGTMAEAELHLMTQRLIEAIRSKAQRGEFRYRLPPAYRWDEAGRMHKHPDEQVQWAIRQVFDHFAQTGTMHRTVSALVDQEVMLPIAKGHQGRLRWQVPTQASVQRILKHPIYAGAYVFGRRQAEEVLDSAQEVKKLIRAVNQDRWHVLIPDHHEGYISWETYERNQQQIRANRRGGAEVGPAREGEALLCGLILCGRCGRRMRVRYGRNRHVYRYECINTSGHRGNVFCQGFGAVRLEGAVQALVLSALEPVGMEAMVEATKRIDQANAQARQQVQQRIERATYEVELARRYYESVDPTNRLVAREVERRFNKALADLEVAQAEGTKKMEALSQPLTPEDKACLLRWAADVPHLWHAPQTAARDRQRIIRCLIEQVVVTVPEQQKVLKVAIHWSGGEVTTIEVPKGQSGLHRYATDAEVVELIRQLAKEFEDAQIARILCRKGLKSAKGNSFTAHRVGCLRARYGIPKGPRVPLQGDDIYTAQQAARLLNVNHTTLLRWLELGLVRGKQATKGAPWRVQVTEADRQRLTIADAPPGWLTLKAAAQALGVSQPTVLQRLKAGHLQAVRVRTGGRLGWRINVITKPSDDETVQRRLFS